jgi:hypothetical protein
MPRLESQTHPDVPYIFVSAVYFSFSYHKAFIPITYIEKLKITKELQLEFKVSGPIIELGLEYTGGVLSVTP